jgi:hypothetical protein
VAVQREHRLAEVGFLDLVVVIHGLPFLFLGSGRAVAARHLTLIPLRAQTCRSIPTARCWPKDWACASTSLRKKPCRSNAKKIFFDQRGLGDHRLHAHQIQVQGLLPKKRGSTVKQKSPTAFLRSGFYVVLAAESEA